MVEWPKERAEESRKQMTDREADGQLLRAGCPRLCDGIANEDSLIEAIGYAVALRGWPYRPG